MSVVFSGDTTVTANLVTLARHTDVLVHEAVYPAGLAALGASQALVDRILATHTDVVELGRIAEADAGALVATRLGPGGPAAVPDATWRRRLLSDGARRSGYGGRVPLGADLMHVPVRPARARRG
ncbi:hypothetical protein [Streptomyces sp. NPDC086519]|uniref:MBL fold metallo-hydrolase n=1 Tax=Streptomyces sp. NPDC086519 TaxID=3154863 RepID=UPI00344AA059